MMAIMQEGDSIVRYIFSHPHALEAAKSFRIYSRSFGQRHSAHAIFESLRFILLSHFIKLCGGVIKMQLGDITDFVFSSKSKTFARENNHRMELFEGLLFWEYRRFLSGNSHHFLLNGKTI